MTSDISADITANAFIDRIFDEANRLLKGGFTLHEDFAYLKATLEVVKQTGRARRRSRLSPREEQVLRAVRCIQARIKHRRGVERKEVVRELELNGIAISEWNVSKTFGDLEEIGLLFREAPRAKTWWDSPPPKPAEKAA
jgi:hypothetical protein